jgi:hypothetical protein
MEKLARWVGSQGDWNPSAWALPALDQDGDAVLQRWRVVAGGLALILSRSGPAEHGARFACSKDLYLLIRRRLRRSAAVDASAELLGEVMHEIAQVADPQTRSCLQACFRARVHGGEGALPVSGEAGGSQLASSIQPLSATSRRSSSRAEALDGAPTSFNTDLLTERARTLRQSIAAARSTAFTDLD